MNNKNKWLAYDELAWEVRSLLHLGCGAGGNDYFFKQHFKVTGIDISEKMLEIAREVNPEANYHPGDMRTIELDECFDAVVAPESIDYMKTEDELDCAIKTAHKHLKPCGLFLVVANTAERFIQNNFVYTGTRGDIEITLFENNYVPIHPGTTYEATIVYLIGRGGKLEIYNDRHILGLFKLETWLNQLNKAGFDVINQINLDYGYDQYIAGESKHPRLIFVCRKTLK